MILIKNGMIIRNDNRTIPQIGNLIIKNGVINDIVQQSIENSEQFEIIIDATGKIIMPGLINGHMHSYANFVKAIIENLPLEMMMPHIIAQVSCMEPEDIYYNTLLGAIEMIKSGTTSCIDQLAQDREGLEEAMRAYDEIGLRATIAPMITDKSYFETLPIKEKQVPPVLEELSTPTRQKLIDTTVDLIKKWHGKKDRLSVAFGPSGPQRCSDELLKDCMDLSKEYNTVFHTHVLETKIQAEMAIYLYRKPMIFHLDEIGCLNERTILVHTVWMTEEEATLAKERGAMIVHCPACNLFLGSGIAPINKYREIGLKVGLGTDGTNGGGNLNMFETMKLAAILHRYSESNPEKWLNAKETLQMATVNCARMIFPKNAVGTLEVGKKADLVILNPNKSCSLQPIQNPIRQIVYGETGSAVETVMVQGRIILYNGKITLLDEKKIYTEVNKRAVQIRERLLSLKDNIDKQVKFLQYVFKK